MDMLIKTSCLCVLVSIVSAFPGYIPHTAILQKKKAYCDALAMKTVMADLELPVAQTNFRRAPGEIYAGDEPIYDLSVNWGVLKELKDISQNDLQSSIRMGAQASQYAKIILTDFNRIRTSCLTKIFEDDNNQDASPLAENMLYDRPNFMKSNEIQAGQISGIPEDRMFKRGQGVSFNPPGWRRRRATSKKNDEEYEHVLHNMRQLLDKRRRRLQFNPSGW